MTPERRALAGRVAAIAFAQAAEARSVLAQLGANPDLPDAETAYRGLEALVGPAEARSLIRWAARLTATERELELLTAVRSMMVEGRCATN